MTYQSRSAWTTRPNRAVPTKYKQQHLTWHYPGFGTNSVKTASWSHDRCLSQINTWEKQHQARGSKNVEYNYFACSHGYLIEGRGDRQNGANGTSASNRRGQSVQVLIGDNEPLTSGHRAAMREAVARIEGLHKGATGTQYGHQHWVGTRCPGPYVIKEIPVSAAPTSAPGGGMSKPVTKPAAKPANLVEDGRLGMSTVKALQSALGVKADGRACEATWKALQRKVGTFVDGVVSNQSYRAKELGNGVVDRCWRFTGRGSKGSKMVVALQKKLGVKADGIWYESTTLALQKALNAGRF